MSHYVRNEDELASLFGSAGGASIRKETDVLHPVYQRWIESSPFAVVATSGPGGLDTSPRGDPAPLVRVRDNKTILMPERRGNNRIDGLRNLIADPKISLLFFIPGINETVRVNGVARISVDPALLESFTIAGNLPKCVVEISIESVFFQCARALLRSELWAGNSSARQVPTAGQMLAELSKGEIDGDSYDHELPVRQRSTLY